MLVKSSKKRSIPNEMLPEPLLLKRKLGQRKNIWLRWGLNSRRPAQNRIRMTTSFRYNRNKSLPVTEQNDCPDEAGQYSFGRRSYRRLTHRMQGYHSKGVVILNCALFRAPHLASGGGGWEGKCSHNKSDGGAPPA